MACRLISAKPLSELMLESCQLDLQEHTSAEFESKYKILIHENAFENVGWEMVVSRRDELTHQATGHEEVVYI